MATRPDDLVDFDGFIMGSPTYLGGVSGQFKTFMDATGRLWRTQGLKGKLAAGFTVSSLPARTSTGLTGNHIPPPAEYAVVPPNRSVASTRMTDRPSRAAV